LIQDQLWGVVDSITTAAAAAAAGARMLLLLLLLAGGLLLHSRHSARHCCRQAAAAAAAKAAGSTTSTNWQQWGPVRAPVVVSWSPDIKIEVPPTQLRHRHFHIRAATVHVCCQFCHKALQGCQGGLCVAVFC
jgi:hypothetical protein